MKKAIKSGDEVVVLTGNNRGHRGRVLRVLPTVQRVLVEGVNIRKHFKKQTQRNPNAPAEEGITERECPIHISNVMLASRFDERLAARK